MISGMIVETVMKTVTTEEMIAPREACVESLIIDGLGVTDLVLGVMTRE